MQSRSTAILFFSRSARAEADEKAIFRNVRKGINRPLFQELLSNTYRTARHTGLPVIWLDESQQRGNGFGERFANAFRQVYDMGYDHVISIGNDCPDLSSGILTEAARQVESSQAVLGPACDGGDYLIALSHEAFDYESFRNLPWQSAHLHQALSRSLRHAGFQPSLLAPLSDVDAEHQLWERESFSFNPSFQKFVNELLAAFFIRHKTATKAFFPSKKSVRQLSLRAPPMAFC